jgi:uncharacterized repeat protein (TIGR03803 family)
MLPTLTHAPLVLSGNTLYGTTPDGGLGGQGALFQVNTDGSGFALLYSFTGGSDGGNGATGLLIPGLVISGSTIYGTTPEAGGFHDGTVFAFTLPPAPLQILNDANFGIRTNAFGFDFSGPANEIVVIEATTNLAGGVWVPLQTNTLGNASIYFSDPAWANYPGRFYRAQVQ